MLKKWYQKVIFSDNEEKKLLAFVAKFAKPQAKILDLGCGYGRYLRALSNQGYEVVGVELNQQIVQANRQAGLNCVSVDEFQTSTTTYDLIICSHVIEHFNPADLVTLLDAYLTRLEKKGYIIIATPLYSHYFFDDFDHVKPYHPLGLEMVFGANAAQVQYYSENKMQLQDIWFRRSPFVSTFQRSKFIRSPLTRVLQVYDLIMSLLHKVSGGLIGQKDGWVGVYQKC
jgi:SAM-dependent methyltransferase